MSKSDFILRVLSPTDGTKRLNVSHDMKASDFISKVLNEFNVQDEGWLVSLDRGATKEIASSRTKTISSYKLKHGDMVYLTKPQVAGSSSGSANGSTVTSSSSRSSLTAAAAGGLLTGDSDEAAKALSRDLSGSVIEDEVDRVISKLDGRIPRERSNYCRHGSNSKCVHCVPYEVPDPEYLAELIELYQSGSAGSRRCFLLAFLTLTYIDPYDEEYLRQVNPPIKFLSFNSYMRKLTSGVDKGKFVMLENLSCKIKPGCNEHAPWPGGICTKCQPNAVTLMRQTYRHVDYVQFENGQIMNRFLSYWRTTGDQRMGYMYGRYEHHKDMPLGIKAVVMAIYEPRQVSTKTSIELIEDEDEAVIEIAQRLGLQKVGWIFTDLSPLDLNAGTVKHFRGDVNSHFLSAEECIMAADLQNRHPNPCKLAPDGHFGSKFVTVVCTGDKDNQIHFEAYQVSNQCMALVRDDCLIPTKDAPELGYAKESTNEQYVPDVFYKGIDEYKNEVTQLARPLPLEYLLVDLPAAFPVELAYTFYASEDIKPFNVEHRDMLGEIQDFSSFCSYMGQFSRSRYHLALNDLHVLAFIATCDVLPLKDELPALLDAMKSKDEARIHGWFKSEAWATVEQLLESHSGSMDHMMDTSSSAIGNGVFNGSNAASVACNHCTYLNPPTTANCTMCGLPLSGH